MRNAFGVLVEVIHKQQGSKEEVGRGRQVGVRSSAVERGVVWYGMYGSEVERGQNNSRFMIYSWDRARQDKDKAGLCTVWFCSVQSLWRCDDARALAWLLASHARGQTE